MLVLLIDGIPPFSQIIILGGGVMHREILLPRVRRLVLSLLNGYIQSPMLTEGLFFNDTD